MQTSKIKTGTIRYSTLETQLHVITEEEKKHYTGTNMEIPNAHKYKTCSITQIINQVTTFKNTPTVFPMEPTTKTKLHQGTDYDITVHTRKYAITVEPKANHFRC